MGYLNQHGLRHKVGQHKNSQISKHHQPGENSIVDTKALDTLENLGTNGVEDENGLICVQKVMMVHETEHDQVTTCVHKYKKQCHATFTTVYEPHQVKYCQSSMATG